MIIDFHTHCFPDAVAPHAMDNLTRLSQYPPHLNGTLGDLRASMQSAGVDLSVVLHIATNPRQNENVNTFALQANKEKGIVSFASVHPDCPDPVGQLCRLREGGIRGIKFHPDFQNFDVDDPRMYPLYEKAADMGFVLLFHCGHDLDARADYHCTPSTFMKVVRDFPDAKIVGAHLGGQDMWEEVFAHTIGKNVYLDTSYAFGWLSDDDLRRVLETHDPEKLLFGTDSPWQGQAEDVRMMQRRLGKDTPLYRKIMGENAAKLLGL